MFTTRHRTRIPAISRLTRRRPLSLTHRSSSHNVPIDVHPEVEDALANGRPVVALESTIITHGLSYPTSLEMAQSVENIVRSTGSIPATIGLIGGRVKIGLQSTELERLASRSADPIKLSRRDIAPAIASKKDGGTTCSSTLIFAALAGIKVCFLVSCSGVLAHYIIRCLPLEGESQTVKLACAYTHVFIASAEYTAGERIVRVVPLFPRYRLT